MSEPTKSLCTTLIPEIWKKAFVDRLNSQVGVMRFQKICKTDGPRVSPAERKRQKIARAEYMRRYRIAQRVCRALGVGDLFDPEYED